MRSRTPWDWRLKLYPFIAAGLFVYAAAQETGRSSYVSSELSRETPESVAAAPSNVAAQTRESPYSVSQVESPSVSRPASAAPQTAAFPDRTCWVDIDGLEYFCFILTAERG